MMTKRMRDALSFINGYIVEHCIAPSMQEIADGLGLKSKDSACRLMRQFEERGIIFHNRRARSIHLSEKANTFGFFEPTPEQALELAEAQRRWPRGRVIAHLGRVA